MRDAEKEGLRGYIPTTFDAMMLDFGNRLNRKEIQQGHNEVISEIVENGGRLETPKLGARMNQNRDYIEKLQENIRESFQLMSSVENELFRKLKDQARREVLV